MTIVKFNLIVLLISGLLISFVFAKAPVSVFTPKTRQITIKPITQSIIHIRPLGLVTIVFPWVLSETNADDLPYFGNIASKNIFKFEKIKGQNVIVVHYSNINSSNNKKAVDLSIQSNGYYFSFTIIADADPSKHYNTIILKLSKKEKLALFDRELKAFRSGLERERAQMIKEIETIANDISLNTIGVLAMGDPDTIAIKEEKIITLKNGDNIVLYVYKIYQFGKFSVVRFEIENKSKLNPLYIKDVRLFSTNDTDSLNQIKSVYETELPKLEPGIMVSGTLSTTTKLADNLKLQLITNYGDVEVTW